RPSSAVAGSPLRFAVEMNEASTGAVLHVRRSGEPSYVSLPMGAAGGGYFAALVPRERVAAPGLEYFIEGTGKGGGAVAVVGAAESPERVEVSEPPRATAPPKRMGTVEVATDYADYNR